MNSDTLDLTRGSVPLCLIRFSFPLLLANLLQSFNSMADLLVVGRFVGETGLAAVSSASTLCFLLNAVCMAFPPVGRSSPPGPGRRGPPGRGGGRRRAVPAGAGGLRPADGGRPALLLPAVHPDGPAFPGYGGRLRLYGHPSAGAPPLSLDTTPSAPS